MSSVSQFAAGGRIKSIQRGVISTNESRPQSDTNLFLGTGSATITAVDTTKSILHYLGTSTNYGNTSVSGFYNSGNNTSFNIFAYLQLTNSTTVTANAGFTALQNSGTAFPLVSVSWQLVEYY